MKINRTLMAAAAFSATMTAHASVVMNGQDLRLNAWSWLNFSDPADYSA